LTQLSSLFSQSNGAWNFAAQMAQPIFTGYALSTKYEMAKLNIDLKEVEKRLAMLDVTRSVKTAYYNVLLTQKALAVANDAAENLEAHVLDAEQFYKHDLVAHNDLLQSQVALANARQNREKARMASEMAFSVLNMLLGTGIDQPTQVADVTDLSPRSYSLEQLTAAALRKRPELTALRIGLKVQQPPVKRSDLNPAARRLLEFCNEPLADNTLKLRRTHPQEETDGSQYEEDHKAASCKWNVTQ